MIPEQASEENYSTNRAIERHEGKRMSSFVAEPEMFAPVEEN